MFYKQSNGIEIWQYNKGVGEQGANKKVDVKAIQAALNLAQSANFKLKVRLVADGKNGDKTIAAIEMFQKDIVKLINPGGRVDPGGKTLKTLKKI